MWPSFPSSSSSPLSLAEMDSKGGGRSCSTPTPSNPPPKTHLHHHHKLQQQQEQGKSEEKLGTIATVTTTTTTTTTTNTNNTTATSSSDSAKRLTRNADADADASVSVLASVPPKRARKGRSSSASSQPQQLPSCQVEGCEADLSSAKEYHRRHKVCQMHSKSAKVMVAGIGQRFCQQCSRFHVLVEFDESKRSCRRRLAGHNERRRKPKTDPMAMRFAAFQDDRHFSQILLQQHLLHYPRMPSFPTCWDGSEQSKLQYCMNPLTMLNPAPLYDYMGMERPMLYSGAPPLMSESINKPLFRFLQNPKGMMMPMQDEITTTTTQKGGYQYNMDGHGLSLFSTLGATTTTTPTATTSSQGIISTAAEISDSRRALSLLSSQPWSSNASAVVAPTMSLELSPRLDMAIDRFIIHGNGSSQPNQLNQLNDPNQPNQPNQPSLPGPFMQFSSSASDQMLSIPMMEKEQCSVGGGFEEAPLPPPQLPILSVMQDQVGACDVQQDKRVVTASIDLGHLLHGSSHGFHLGPDSDDYNSLQALRCGVSMFDSHQLI